MPGILSVEVVSSALGGGGVDRRERVVERRLWSLFQYILIGSQLNINLLRMFLAVKRV